MSHKKWKPEVIAGEGKPKAPDPDPITGAFGHSIDRFVANYYRTHKELDQDAALIVLMQYVAGVAITRGCPEDDFVRCLVDLYRMERDARTRDEGA